MHTYILYISNASSPPSPLLFSPFSESSFNRNVLLTFTHCLNISRKMMSGLRLLVDAYPDPLLNNDTIYLRLIFIDRLKCMLTSYRKYFIYKERTPLQKI